jgi:ParB family chromosome partitioning protein
MELQNIPVNKIRPNPSQPRTTFEKGSLEELSESIKEHGLVQPIIVRKVGKEFELIAGERRWRASQLAGMKEIPAVVKDIEAKETLLESFLENVNREDLTAIEQENAIAELWQSGNFKTQEDLGRKLGKKGNDAAGFVKRHVTAKGLRDRFKAPQSVSTQHLYEISVLDEKEDQKLAIDRAVSENLSVHEMRALIQTLKAAPAPIKKAVLRNKVDLEDVRKLVERGATDVGDKQAFSLLEDLEMLKEHKQLMQKEAQSIVDETLNEVARSAKTGKERQIIIDKQKEELGRDERIFNNSVTPVFELVHGWHIDYDRLKTQRWKDAFMKRVDAVDKMIHEFMNRKA